MLKKLSIKLASDFSIFSQNILWYFLSVFMFSRLFYVIGKWNELKYIKDPFDFFIMNDYNFSLVGAFIGFFVVLIINLRIRKEELEKYIDTLVLSFIFILFIGFAGAILGGQVYGIDTHFGIEVLYTHSFTPIPFQVPIFPLPIIYSILYFILFSILYILSMYIHIRGLLGYTGLTAMASILLIFDFFSGKSDILKEAVGMNITQLFSIFLIIFCTYKLYYISKNSSSNKDTTLIS
ncbi:hypothetical protein A9Q91_00065 [Candidatus Gracilibacteria bacterium 28_42_T64]|nr:hypothetical protein A9Q91_00065 [Candidatus Gracilibacteria bacterium 28_42_T64]